MIRFKNVYVKYDSGVPALSKVDLHIGKGEFVYIVGKTGAGKSTFIKLIYREIKAEHSNRAGKQARNGTVYVDGQDVSKIPNHLVPYYRRKLGVVFQDFKLLEKKTVFENVAFALEVIDTPRKEIKKRVNEALALVDLTDKANAFPNQLSGGQKQRVAIARAIVNKPKVLIADEPTGNLDPSTSDEIINLLLKINEEEKTTIIMVTHDTAIVQKYPRRTISIVDGCISNDGEFSQETYEKLVVDTSTMVKVDRNLDQSIERQMKKKRFLGKKHKKDEEPQKESVEAVQEVIEEAVEEVKEETV